MWLNGTADYTKGGSPSQLIVKRTAESRSFNETRCVPRLAVKESALHDIRPLVLGLAALPPTLPHGLKGRHNSILA